jgi:hypothetical protein
MRGKVLFDRSSSPELIAGRDLPEAYWWFKADKPMHQIIFVFTRILVLVINLQLIKEHRQQN